MSIDQKKILIVSYTLPPYGGIGGRRWTKFGIELMRRGYSIKFLSPIRKAGKEKRWEKDFEKIKDQVHYFKSSYPSVLKSTPGGLLDKFAYRIWLRRIKKNEKGNYHDSSSLDYTVLKESIQNSIKEGFQTIISTGAPFTQLFHLAKLRNELNSFKLIVDLRDPWTMQDWSYGFQNLSEARKLIEQEREKFVMEYADKVITVLPKMTSDLSALVEDKSKFHTIYNGFDPGELNDQADKMAPKEEQLKFVFAGNYYDNALHHIKALVDYLARMKNSSPTLYNKLNFEFYGNAPSEFHEIIKDEDAILHHGFIPSSQVNDKIAKADVGMLFLIDGFNYSLSTKFFEYLLCNKPILVFTKSGDTSNFIEGHQLGWYFVPSSEEDIFYSIAVEKQKKGKLAIPNEFDKDQFSINRLTDQIEAVINDL